MRSFRTFAVVVFFFVAIVIPACTCGQSGTSEPRGLDRRGPGGGSDESESDPFYRDESSERRDPLRRSSGSASVDDMRKAREAERAKAPEEEEDEEPARDLGAELRTAASNATSCARAEGANELPERTQLRIEAHVTATGIVTRATASSADLSAEALQCFERRIESYRFAAPVPDAPRSVSTTVVFERQAL